MRRSGEDWVADQVERGIDVLITNPELVKTGLDLLDFPTIVFLQSGFNVYTVQQAARRSWRIGVRGAMEQGSQLSLHQCRSVPSMRASLSEKQCRSSAPLAMSVSNSFTASSSSSSVS